jgi:phosphoribosylaminoimidazole-succinocarboxamide synthase
MDQMPKSVQEYRDQLEGRVMLVKKCAVLPVEAIVRGYITGVCICSVYHIDEGLIIW